MTDVFKTRLVTQHQHTDRKLDCCARKLEPTAIGRLNQMKPNDIKDVLKTSASSC